MGLCSWRKRGSWKDIIAHTDRIKEEEWVIKSGETEENSESCNDEKEAKETEEACDEIGLKGNGVHMGLYRLILRAVLNYFWLGFEDQ